MLDGLDVDAVRNLSVYIRQAQLEKSPISRSGILTSAAMQRNADWLVLQDIPGPVLRTSGSSSAKSSQPSAELPKVSPPRWREKQESPTNSPVVKPQISTGRIISRSTTECLDDGVFVMDDGDMAPPSFDRPTIVKDTADSLSQPTSGWRKSVAPKYASTISCENES